MHIGMQTGRQHPQHDGMNIGGGIGGGSIIWDIDTVYGKVYGG